MNQKKTTMKTYLIWASALALSGTGQTQTLSALLERARLGEPTYLGAKTQVVAAQARHRQALGAMLPQLSVAANTNTNKRNYLSHNSSAGETQDAFNSNLAQLNLTQPLVRYANNLGWRQAGAVVGQAEHQLAGAKQELFAKVVTAWFELLAARDAVDFTAQQAKAMRRQWEIVSRGGDLGLYGMPQVDEAHTKLEQALADAAMAQSEAYVKHAELEQLVGLLPPWDLPYLQGEAVLASPTRETLEQWLAQAEVDNPNVQAAARAMEAASAEVRKQYAGHYPTLDLVASYGKNGQGVGSVPGQAGYEVEQASIGLQLNVPLYSGGAQKAKVHEAIAQEEKARWDWEGARRVAALNTKQAWFSWQGAVARARAGAQAIRSARWALAQARAGDEQGLKTELDVLQARQQLGAGQRDFRKGRYDQVVAFVRLLAASGKLTDADVLALDLLLVRAPEAADPPQSAGMAQVSEQ